MLSVLKLAARAAIWRASPEPNPVGLPTLVAWCAVLALVRGALEFIDAGPSPGFNLYGLNAIVAWVAIAVALAAFLVPRRCCEAVLSAMVLLSILAEIVIAALDRLSALVLSISTPGGIWTIQTIAAAVLSVDAVWWIGAMAAVFRSVQPSTPARVIGRAATLWLVLFVAKIIVPHAPAFIGPSFDVRNANLWEYMRADQLARHPVDPDIATDQLAQTQPPLLRAAFAGLAPRQKGVTNVYAIGVAGWSDQDVFVKELDGALAAIGRDLPIKDRSVRLVNHRDTVGALPLASRRNFAAAVHAVGELMDKQEDVMILLMTSHGTTDGIALQLPDGGRAILGPQEVASVLDHEGIKNRVVIVSACYSGIFVQPLANDNTIVLTAADQNSTSFGCAAEREWTYFGDALFNQGLQPGTDFKTAFNHARILIDGWELMDGAPSSHPQGYFGATLVEKLQPVLDAMAQTSQ